ncbi:family Taurine catabolism dioxygenase [Fusarium beomiforme]|uniref:Family Taurine catabolism dioxygenase n=1 Tax=Fusarium beomiforme TaxID=44412 RepID=A0A9P5ARZ9_9HYPO|nr:family Taurine catabolism dioxygenase [Fusarium beomiforme]
MSEISFHNEETGDIISWLTRSSAASGGRCIIASGYAVYNILSRYDRESLRLLSQPKWTFANQEASPRPIFFYHKNRVVLNFGRVPLMGNAIHPRPRHLPRISLKQLMALENIERAARKVQLEIKTQPGDIHFINNLFILHRRDSFEDGDAVGAKRHLVRMRLRDDEFGWDLPDCLRKEWSDAFDDTAERSWHIDPMPEGFFPLRSYPN